jgi:hypothetical protein
MMNPDELNLNDGRIFGVYFVKRTTGEVRHMVCRTGVTKHLKGGNKAYDAASKLLLTVYDVQKEGYRSIPLDAVIQIEHHGTVTPGPLFDQFQAEEVA